MTPLRAALGATLLIVAIGAVVALSESRPRLSGTNSVKPVAFLGDVQPGQQVCQGGELVPGDTGAVGVFAGTYQRAAGPLSVVVSEGGRAIASGRSAGGLGDGTARIPVRRIARTVSGTQVCVRNDGPVRVTLAGLPAPPSGAAALDGAPYPGRLQLDYFRPGRERWWSLIGPITHRFGFGKAAFLGSWSLWLAAGLLAAAWAVAIGTLLRRLRP